HAAPGPQTTGPSYTASGRYTVTFTASDSYGGTTTVSVPIEVKAAELQADPLGGTALVVGGTAGADTIAITPAGGGAVRVKVNGTVQGTFAPTGRIIVYGQAGNHIISVRKRLHPAARRYRVRAHGSPPRGYRTALL